MTNAAADDSNYEPSSWEWVADQVAEYEASGGTRANTLLDTGLPIIVVTTVGHKTSKTRKFPLMRVEYDGEYGLIASKAGSPTHPGWYFNLAADPQIKIQDGAEALSYEVRELSGEERSVWYDRGIEAYGDYQAYADATEGHREIPVFVATKTD